MVTLEHYSLDVSGTLMIVLRRSNGVFVITSQFCDLSRYVRNDEHA